MILNEISKKLDLQSLTPELIDHEAVRIRRAHASDLLSDVLANAPAGGVLLTIQVHLNVIAVAVHANQAAVVFTSGMVPEDRVLEKAVQEHIPLYSTKCSTFDVAGKLFALGIRGRNE